MEPSKEEARIRALNGRGWEREFFGFDSSIQFLVNSSYVSFKAALQDARDNQPQDWNPSGPATLAAGYLYSLVKDELGVETQESRELKFFVALGRCLDIFHRVDAFFEYMGRIVTIDITIRPREEKRRSLKYKIRKGLIDVSALDRLAIGVKPDFIFYEKYRTMIVVKIVQKLKD